MTITKYETIIRENLSRFFSTLPDDAASRLGAKAEGGGLFLTAFGKDCRLTRDGVMLAGTTLWEPVTLLVALYALHAGPEPMVLDPFKSFKDLPNSMPYQGAFTANAERVLIPHVPHIHERRADIMTLFQGQDPPADSGGDFGFTLLPLPKVALCYIFYHPDDEFPASATCLFSANALSFMPLDGLADVGEYTSRAILELLKS